MTNAILNKFLRYKTTKEIEEPFVYILHELLERKIIKINSMPRNIEYYQDAYEKAKRELELEYSKATSTDSAERNQIKNELVKILNGDSSKIKIRQMRIVLKGFFEKHIELNDDFINIIT